MRFTSAQEICAGLRDQTPSGLTESMFYARVTISSVLIPTTALTRLRNQLTIRAEESVISTHDERLLLVKEWLDTNPGAQDLFDLWEDFHPVLTSSLVLRPPHLSLLLASTRPTWVASVDIVFCIEFSFLSPPLSLSGYSCNQGHLVSAMDSSLEFISQWLPHWAHSRHSEGVQCR